MVVDRHVRKRSLYPLTLAIALAGSAGCDPPAPEDPATTRPVPVMEGPSESERDFGLRRTEVGRDEPAASPETAPRDAAAPVELDIGGKPVPFPPAELRLSSDATAVLIADGGSRADLPPNVLYFQMVPITDGEKPWSRAVWTYRLTSAEELPTQGLFIGSAENQLRPVRIDLEILRRPGDPGHAEVSFTGLFVPADAPDPLLASGYEVRGSMRVKVAGP